MAVTPEYVARNFIENVRDQFALHGHMLGDPRAFRDSWRDLSDDERRACFACLKKSGIMSEVFSRKRSIPTASEIIDDTISHQTYLRGWRFA